MTNEENYRSQYHWAANRIAELEKTVEELELVKRAAGNLIIAARKKYWEGLGDELKALADALGERFPL